MHVPVFLQEVLEMLDPRPGDFVIDGTVDGGGHAAAILARIGPSGTFLGLDLDETMLADCKKRIAHGKEWRSRSEIMPTCRRYLIGKDWERRDGLLLDLGFSSEQIAHSGRGFSFSEASRSEPLLMTYDDSRVPVRDMLATISEKELADILSEFGGEHYANRIAKAIVLEAERKRRDRDERRACGHGPRRGPERIRAWPH